MEEAKSIHDFASLNLCRDCGKFFNDLTNTPISGTRYLGKWSTFFHLIVEGYTLPKIAKRLKIHLSTAFYWRHKVLFALRSLRFQTLKGIFESDETFFKESFKGREVIDRKAKKRGGRDEPASNIFLQVGGEQFSGRDHLSHCPLRSTLATDRLNSNEKSSTRKFWLNYIIRTCPFTSTRYSTTKKH